MLLKKDKRLDSFNYQLCRFKYQKKTSRSKRKLRKIKKNAVKVDIANGQATFQINIPLLIKH